MNGSNAVTRSLDELQVLWKSYRMNKHSRLCRLFVSEETVSLIHAFIQRNAAESSDSPDIFLRFSAPFAGISNYGQALSEELSSLVEADREALAKDGIEISWTTQHRDEPQNAALGFLRNIFHLALSLDFDDRECLVACMTPAAIESPKEWLEWWTNALFLQLPPQVRLLVCETPETNYLETLATRFPETFTTLQPSIDGQAVMRELMDEYGDPNDPATHFRKAFLELSQRVATRDAAGIRDAAKKALDLARQMGMPHLEIAVLCAGGNGLCIAGEIEPGIKCFDQARRMARQTRSEAVVKEMPGLTAESLYDQLGVHAAFFKGAALMGAERYDQACAAYEEAARDLRALINVQSTDPVLRFLMIDALRMSGLCKENAGEKQAASPFYEEALQEGERLDAASRKNTTLAWCGQSLIAIYRSSSQKNTCLIAQEKMNALLGADWEQSLPQRAA